MKKIYRWYNNLSKRVRDSAFVSMALMGSISTLFSILGISLGDCKLGFWLNILIVLSIFTILFFVIYFLKGIIFKDSIKLLLNQTSILINCGNIFEASGWKVIGCDTHFDTRIDDMVITKKSLHGQLFLEHGKKEEIKKVLDIEAKRLNLKKNRDGLYDFPIGTVIRYDSSIDNQTYLLLAMNELNSDYEAHTNMANYELMLMRMWKEIDRIYACHDIVLPVLGAGITRFDDGPKNKRDLLRCMLCTLNSSRISFNSEIRFIIYGNASDIPLYEYKNIF